MKLLNCQEEINDADAKCGTSGGRLWRGRCDAGRDEPGKARWPPGAENYFGESGLLKASFRMPQTVCRWSRIFRDSAQAQHVLHVVQAATLVAQETCGA
ncbi:hypothetical protein SAMN04515620_108143 [Collimonas sp. OK607]|nr:hypothetical protein SAMN04515620_108143 [Collimonas sp. OK607]